MASTATSWTDTPPVICPNAAGCNDDYWPRSAVIGDLCFLPRKIPTRKHENGRYLDVDRHHTMLEVVVSDLEFTDRATDVVPDAVVTSHHRFGDRAPLPST